MELIRNLLYISFEINIQLIAGFKSATDDCLQAPKSQGSCARESENKEILRRTVHTLGQLSSVLLSSDACAAAWGHFKTRVQLLV